MFEVRNPVNEGMNNGSHDKASSMAVQTSKHCTTWSTSSLKKKLFYKFS